ncbi:MAG: SxtJ family membrane protein [Candidatus Omnitrophota bacterium]
MSYETKNIETEKNEWRRFGISFGVGMLILGGLLFLKGTHYYLYLWPISVAAFSAAIFCPQALKPVHKVFSFVGTFLGWLLTAVILIFIFYIVMTPIGIILRILGKDTLQIKLKNPNAQSYWITKNTSPVEETSYEKQY